MTCMMKSFSAKDRHILTRSPDPDYNICVNPDTFRWGFKYKLKSKHVQEMPVNKL